MMAIEPGGKYFAVRRFGWIILIVFATGFTCPGPIPHALFDLPGSPTESADSGPFVIVEPEESASTAARPAGVARYMLPFEYLFLKEFKLLRQARDFFPPDSREYARLDRAMAMYGDSNRDNGVHLSYRESGKSDTLGHVTWKNEKEWFDGGTVTFNIRDINPVSIAHEGIHLWNFARQVNPDRFGELNFDLFSEHGRLHDELCAYHASALVAEGLGHGELTLIIGDRKWRIWNREDGFQLETLLDHLAYPREKGGYGLDIPSDLSVLEKFLE